MRPASFTNETKESRVFTTDPVTVREGVLLLTLLDEDEGILHIECAGQAVLPDFQEADNPLTLLLGPEGYARKVLLDLDRVQFLDTTGVTWLLSSHEHFRRGGGKVVLHSLPAQARRVLRLLRLDHLLTVAPDAAAGRALLEGKKV
jgi:anti-anti-sigma factor